MNHDNNNNGDSSDSSDEESLKVNELIATAVGEAYTELFLCKQPYRNDNLSGAEYVLNVVLGNPNRCPDMFRMESNVFFDFCDALKQRGLLQDSRFVTVEEQVGMFLMTVGYKEPNRYVADRFQHSGETVCRHFMKVLGAVCKYAKDTITDPEFSTIHPHLKNEKYWPFFEGAVGAIDGTHISAYVPAGKTQIPYRGRKVSLTQNIMCACDFDMCFTFVYAGWEGSANDARVFMEAIADEASGFIMPPSDKYYLVDAGYPNISGFLTPYKGQRYHLSDYRGRVPRTAKERFNYLHSSLRNVIERTFGVLKARFPILKMMPSYSLRKQRRIVIACCAVHNFIRRHRLQDILFDDYQREDMVIGNEGAGPSSINVDASQRSRREMSTLRDEICQKIADRYGLSI